MSVDSYFVHDKQGVQALHYNALVQATKGYAVLSGGYVTIGSGTLGASDTLTVPATTVLYDAEVHELDADTVTLPDSDPDPRWDLVYATDGGYDVLSGDAEPADPEETDRTNTKRPAPPDLRYHPDTGGDMDQVVPLALVWVPGGGQQVAADDIERIRMGADLHGGDGSMQSLTVEESPSTLTGVIRRAELNGHLGDNNNPHNVSPGQIGAADDDDLSDIEGELTLHVEDEGNPHNVTAAQVGAADGQVLTDHLDNEDNPHNVTAIQAEALPADGGTVDGDVTITGTLSAGEIDSVGTFRANTDSDASIYTPESGALVIMDGELDNEIIRIRSNDGRVTLTREVEVDQRLTAGILEAEDYVQLPVLDEDPENAPDGAWWINGSWSPN